MLTERLQILVRPDQRLRLEAEARRRGSSVGALVREAVDAQFGSFSRSDRLKALEDIRQMRAELLTPQELNRIAAEERDREFTKLQRRSQAVTFFVDADINEPRPSSLRCCP